MKTFLEFFLVLFLRTALWFRYRITIKGLDNLNAETLNKPGGILFLPNHPTVFVDATSTSIALWPRFRLRHMIVDYMYKLPVINAVMRFLDALPVPDFSTSSNSLKRKKSEKVIQEVIDGLKAKKNFLIFPSGKSKQTAYEAIDGASAAHRIIQETPEANIVLVRIKGLWGSSFSRALTGHSPPFFYTLIQGAKHVLKNLIFFTPRRDVIIEFVPAPKNFPYNAGRLEFNKALEHWFNQPDGLKPQMGEFPGDSLILVSYSMWSEDYPKVWEPKGHEEKIRLEKIPDDVRQKITNKIAELNSSDPVSIKSEMNLSTDLGLDSLDIAELVAYLQDQFDISGINADDLTTVDRLMGIASKQIVSETQTEEKIDQDTTKWHQPVKHNSAYIAEGKTIPEVFLNNCARMGNAVACADPRTGVATYSQLKLRMLGLAEHLKNLPGEYIGIMLPASTAASMCILACQLAGKVPLMVNWTVGSRHLQAVSELSKVQIVLSSWSFIDRLQNVDLTGIEDQLVMLEDLKNDISIASKIKAAFLSKMSTNVILKSFGADKVGPDANAVLLFTSGTESMPKGVPLSHNNILSNLRAALNTIQIYTDDVIYGILPPFHSFGFTISSLVGLLSGARVAFSPDPTDGKKLAQGFEHWGVTIVLGAPTFIKGMVKAADPQQLKTMRLCITGAEKLPLDLEQSIVKLGKADSLLEGYGITECSPVLTFTPQGKPRKGVGMALPGIDLCIVDLEKHLPVATGQQGLILARGPNVFKAYLNPGLAKPFLEVNGLEWYLTGDLGFLDEAGNLTLSGRLKRFVKVGGEMVSLAAIEDALSQFALKQGLASLKEEAPVLAISAKEIAGEKPKISLFCKFNSNIDDINKALKDAGFSNLVKITSVTQMDEIPLMGSGKINYRKLEEAS